MRARRGSAVLAALALVLSSFSAAGAVQNETRRISSGPDGAPANGDSGKPPDSATPYEAPTAPSATGRFVAFSSTATNLTDNVAPDGTAAGGSCYMTECSMKPSW